MVWSFQQSWLDRLRTAGENLVDSTFLGSLGQQIEDLRKESTID
jgi:hypothetical protein